MNSEKRFLNTIVIAKKKTKEIVIIFDRFVFDFVKFNLDQIQRPK
jgi:hypothetical protein